MKYCRADVEILTIGVQEFRHQFIDTSGLDPWSRCITLASFSMETFRAICPEAKTIGVTPVGGYKNARNGSKSCAVWLDSLQDPLIEREQRIGNYYADGLRRDTKTVYEFFGCYYHGCPDCDLPGYPLGDKTRSQLYENTMNKIKYYRDHGWKLVECWEHSFKALRESNPDFNTFALNRFRYYTYLENETFGTIRDSFHGARTNNAAFGFTVEPGWTGHYFDFCSLYPAVLSQEKFPTGHPIQITENFDYTLKSYFGFVDLLLEPPQQLEFPVLPTKVDNKLVFHLCPKCAATKQQSECKHSRSERMMRGTWATPELLVALEQGYKIIKIYKVFHYGTKSDTLFKPYIDLWLQIKAESGGFPAHVKTDAQKQAYIDEYYRREGIKLDINMIVKNPGRRTVAKLMLNSLWGKLAQRPNLTQTTLCIDYQDFWTIMNDPSKEILGFILIQANPDKMLVSWRFIDDKDARAGNTSIAIASFTTTYGRLRLLDLINKIELNGPDRIIYFDTDSLVFLREEDDMQIETGDYLGDLTDEISKDYGPDARLTRGIFLGPKSYGLQITMPDGSIKTSLKIKGITLHNQTTETVTFDNLEYLIYAAVETSEPEHLTVRQQTIEAPDKQTQVVRSREFNKIVNVTGDKRRRVGYRTKPYGYC